MFILIATAVVSVFGKYADGGKINLTDPSLYATFDPNLKPSVTHKSDKLFKSKSKDARKAGSESNVKIDFYRVINNFMNAAPATSFLEHYIRHHFENDENNTHNTTMMVSIRNGRASFTHHFPESRHGRAGSVKYIIQKVLENRVNRNSTLIHNVTFLVMVNDGHRPRVPTFGSARHWKQWNMLIPVPLGNQRGVMEGWGTPLEGWDAYVKRRITNTHQRYPWRLKENRALFRGALGMQTYTLGSCNWVNHGACRRASRWYEVNRGALYVIASKHKDLFDVGFTSHKSRPNTLANSFDQAPEIVPNMPFENFQNYKFLLNIGSNQGTY